VRLRWAPEHIHVVRESMAGPSGNGGPTQLESEPTPNREGET
jgi:hypothetical protein